MGRASLATVALAARLIAGTPGRMRNSRKCGVSGRMDGDPGPVFEKIRDRGTALRK
jgi:hypothetical protein